jgi:parvulin-like peptidyl-prolyl isomerase
VKLRSSGLILAAVFLGAVAGELLCRWPAFRDLAGRVIHRGRLIRIVNGKGIYETDLGGEQNVSESDAILAENLRRAAAAGKVDSSRVEAPFTLLFGQFADQKKFDAALRSAGLTDSALRTRLEEQLGEVDWLENQIAPTAAVTEQECRRFYDAHPELFRQPVRYRAAHLFLASHAETPPEVVEEKEKAIAALEARLKKGERLSALAELSEDEASKGRGGDLGYFSEARMPADFMVEIKRLRVGETSKPFRSHLGFHIAQLTEIKAARVLSFEAARSEIFSTIANEHRATSVARIVREISAFASR